MLQLAAGLDDAAGASDWDRLQRLAASLPAQLQQLAAGAPLAPDEQQALARLRQSHAHAAAACGRAARALGQRLDDMHVNKEGRMAYALAGGAEPAETDQ